MYKDNKENAKKNMSKSDKNRASYYKLISGSNFGDVNNYDLSINASIGVNSTVDLILDYIKDIKKH